jgi:prolyl 4-hydroxylase
MATVPLEYVRVYDNILPQNFCDHLIHLIKNSWDKEVVQNDGRPNFTQLNVNQHDPDLVAPLVRYAMLVAEKYGDDLPFFNHWAPPVSGMEEFRVKYYNGGSGDRFDDHVDVGDITSCKRYLAMLFYLNDDFTGGETTFLDYNPDTHGEYQDLYDIQPKTGSVMVFPPMWMFPHAGRPVIDGTKYIMSTYLNYT